MAVTVAFKNNADEVLHLLKSATATALFDIGAACQEYTKDGTPVRTGNLRDSWEVRVHEDEQYVEIGVTAEDANYGKYVELGTSKQPARHMLGNAVNQHLDEYKRLAAKAFKNA